uniref:Uncharacterized protein n=1 Tax=Sus scrofa TaxID=9823 RepID=A0A4X1WD14_PIG
LKNLKVHHWRLIPWSWFHPIFRLNASSHYLIILPKCSSTFVSCHFQYHDLEKLDFLLNLCSVFHFRYYLMKI